MKWRCLGLCLSALLTLSCGTYRSGSSGYRGMGDLQTPGSQADSEDSEAEDHNGPSVYSQAEMHGSRNSRTGAYIPKGSFKVYWPVNNVKLNRGFRPASDPRHEGIDLGGTRGTPILAAHEGLVIYAGRGFSGYGKMVLIEYDGQWASLYAHLNKIIAREGQIVRARDPIGEMGATGRASGVHLHFELIHNRLPTDPMRWLSKSNSYTRR